MKTQLDKLATELVGDGKTPNMFFVSIHSRVKMITFSFESAKKYWNDLCFKNRRKDSCIEDRKNGEICSYQEHDGIWQKFDDSKTFGVK